MTAMAMSLPKLLVASSAAWRRGNGPAVGGRVAIAAVSRPAGSSSVARLGAPGGVSLSHCGLSPNSPRLTGAMGSKKIRAEKTGEKGEGGELQSAPTEGMDLTGILSSVGIGLLWAGLLYYATALSPNQTPVRDSYFLEKLVGLGVDDGVSVNQVYTAIFNLMGVWPGVYACLLVPSGRSGNKIPAWPFVTLSFAAGVFALLPYVALWQQPREVQKPPTPEDLEAQGGAGAKVQRVLESRVNAALLLAGALAMGYQLVTAGGAQWATFFKLFDESRLVHVTTVDFCCLTALAPFWVYNDAQARGYKGDSLLPLFCSVPVAGPALYLLLRPRNFTL